PLREVADLDHASLLASASAPGLAIGPLEVNMRCPRCAQSSAAIDDAVAGLFIAAMPSRVSRLYLVDVSSYIFRAFHAIPPLNNKNGLPTNAILGVVNMLLKLVNEERPEAIAIVFDAGGPTFRDEIADDYKANRTPTPEALRPQLPYVRKVVEAFRLRCVE